MLVLYGITTLFAFGLIIYYASERSWETMIPWVLIFMSDISYLIVKLIGAK